MQTLRNAHFLARFVLVWFALSIGVAVASPLVQPKSLQLVCSSAGVVSLQFDQGDGGGAGSIAGTLDCPMCAAVGAPPPNASLQVLAPMGLSYAQPALPSQPVAYRAAAALPARGPPASL